MKYILLVFLFTTSLLFGQIAGDFRSGGNVNFNSTTNWLTYNGSAWVAAATLPTTASATNKISIVTGHTATANTAGSTLLAKLEISGTVDVTQNFNTAEVILLNGGRLNIRDAVTYYAYGDVTVNAGAFFNANYNPGTATYIIIYGNYYNYGSTDFWKTNVIIVGNFYSPTTSTLQNQGNVVVGGDMIGDFDFLGSGTNQLYSVNPNATINVTVQPSGSNITPGTDLSAESVTLQNLVASIFGTCIAGLATTWNGSSWNNGTPNTSKAIVINGNYNISTNVTACSLTVNAGATLTIQSNVFFNIYNNITNNGTIIVENSGSLIQVSKTATYTGNPMTYKRKTTPVKQYDYTYYASPMVGSTLNEVASNSLFYKFDTSINNWVYQTSGTTMNPGVGYISRAPSNLTYSPTQIIESSFVGTPNNGDVAINIVKTATSSYNLIGNPYPSAIDIDDFIIGNPTAVNGTIYLWTHNTAITNNNYTVNDYAKYNLTGGVGTGSAALSGGSVPTNKIGACQGFFIEASSAAANGTYVAKFNNTMRISSGNSNFFRANNSPQVTNKNRLWLSLHTTTGRYSEILVGYLNGATNDYDRLFDGTTMNAGTGLTFYSLLNDKKLAIQGKGLPFVPSDVIPLGYEILFADEVTISRVNYDGFFEEQDVYLLDKQLNTYTHLNTSDYTFYTTEGLFNDRFELHFKKNFAGKLASLPAEENKCTVYKISNELVIESSVPLQHVNIYDISGKIIATLADINQKRTVIHSLTTANSLILLDIDLQDGTNQKVKYIW